MLQAQSLGCRRGRRMVFRGADFTLAPGGLLLVRGANGSGKSSLLRVLAGLLEAAEGELRWQGARVDDGALHRARVCYVGHLDALKPELTVRETLDYCRVLCGQKTGADALEAFALAPLAERPVRMLSAGQMRRLSLSRLTLSAAPLWLLDEPGSSLDAKGRGMLVDLVARHRAAGGMIVLASHEAENFPDARTLTLDGAA